MTYFAPQSVSISLATQTYVDITTQDGLVILVDNNSLIVQVFVSAFATNRFTAAETRGIVATYLFGFPLLTELNEILQTEIPLTIGVDGYTESVNLLSAVELGLNTFQVVSNDYE
jgi:hypothetical protein